MTLHQGNGSRASGWNSAEEVLARRIGPYDVPIGAETGIRHVRDRNYLVGDQLLRGPLHRLHQSSCCVIPGLEPQDNLKVRPRIGPSTWQT